MKNLFTKPVMDISMFDTENVVTVSGGITGTDATTNIEAIKNGDTYTKATASWATANNVLQFN